jgi:hypothetical protein
MVFPVPSATEATIGHMEIAIIAKKKKLRQDRSKVMLELFFDSSGIVNMESFPEGATVNKHHYKEILHRLRKSVRRKHVHCLAMDVYYCRFLL